MASHDEALRSNPVEILDAGRLGNRVIDRVIDGDLPAPVRLGAVAGLAVYAAARAFLVEAPLATVKEVIEQRKQG